MVLPPGPVYPPTRPSMLTVGRDISSSSASRQLTSCTQWSTPSCRFVTCSSSRFAASAIMACSAVESGRALSAKPSIAGSLPSGETSVASGEERRLGALLVHRAPAYQHGSHIRLLDERGGPRRRRPFRGIDLFDVIHEVDAQGARRTGIERREDSRLAVGRQLRDLVEPGVAQQLHRE